MRLHKLSLVLTIGFAILAFNANSAEVTPVTPANAALRYFGRWSSDKADERVSQWAGAYLKFAFTGSRVTLKLGAQPSSFYAIIDAAPEHFEARTGDIVLTAPAGDGTAHQVTLIAQVGKALSFRGLDLPAGQELRAAAVHPGHVLFIGDSITFGSAATNPTLDGWAPASARAAGMEHDRIAQGGVGLVSGYDAPAGKVGMEDRFFKLRNLGTPAGNKAYPLESDRQPAVIVVNLGTNDGNKNEKNPVPMEVFKERYAGFVGKLRQRYPHASILALELFNTFASAKNDAIRKAVETVRAGGDNDVHFISTKGWVNPDPKGGDIKPDWSHPTDQGHAKLAAKMAEVLRRYAAASPRL